jgi:tetratricopeptide (TPR) repeat protein
MEDHPTDSFGKQLKSFTDWLKVMKRLPQKQLIPEKTDEWETDRIRRFAANSIEERDILTETMAEVLAKQGMYENAIALYQKLSLIYPPKSAYFASRIEQLKASLS